MSDDTALQETQNDGAVPAPQSIASSMIPRTLGELESFAKTVSQSQLCPKSYRGKPQDVTLAILYGMEIGLRPLQALQSVAVINGRPSIYGDAALALVEESGLAEYVDEWQEREDGELVAFCETKRKGRPEPVLQSFSESEAKTAGLWGKRGPWQDYPRRMLQMRARSWTLRDAYPDVLEGLYLAEEAEAIPASNGPTIDPGGLTESEDPDSGYKDHHTDEGRTDPRAHMSDSEPDIEYVQRYGITITASQAEKLDEWDAELATRDGEKLEDAIESVEDTIQDWPSERLVAAFEKMLGEHRKRLSDDEESEDSEPEGTPLPEDMPSRNFYVSAGVETVEELQEHLEAGTLADVEGLGETTAKTARQWLENRDE